MEESCQQKPFVCVEVGCGMTFTNEDHLNWHQKKHDMILNLGLANKNSEACKFRLTTEHPSNVLSTLSLGAYSI